MSRINLVPADHVRRRAARRRLRIWANRCLLCGGLLAGAQGFLLLRIRHETARADTLQQSYVVLQEDLAAAETLINERDRLAKRLVAIRRISAGTPASSLVEIVSEALPRGTYLTHFHVDRTLSPAVDGAQSAVATPILVRGVAESHGEIGSFVRALTETHTFESVEVRSVSERASRARRSLDFELVCHVGGDHGVG